MDIKNAARIAMDRIISSMKSWLDSSRAILRTISGFMKPPAEMVVPTPA